MKSFQASILLENMADADWSRWDLDELADEVMALWLEGNAVHVLHAFQKKSKSGIATPQPDVELIEKRLKTVLARYGASRRS